MLDAIEMCPQWAAAVNFTDSSWSNSPAVERYDDYARYLRILFERYGPHATAVEVSNEDDGLASFDPHPVRATTAAPRLNWFVHGLFGCSVVIELRLHCLAST